MTEPRAPAAAMTRPGAEALATGSVPAPHAPPAPRSAIAARSAPATRRTRATIATVSTAAALGLAATAAWAATGTQAPRPAAATPVPLNSAAAAPNSEAAALQATTAALGDLGLALLRETPGANAVVSPLAVATVLGMIQSGATGATEREIEALFGAGQAGAMAMRRSLPALSAQLRRVPASEGTAGKPAPMRQAARVWIDAGIAKEVPPAFKQRLAQRHGADAVTLSFADTEAARALINRWTAEHTAGRVAECFPRTAWPARRRSR